MIEVTVTTVGNSTGIILPKEVLAHLDVKKGDKLFLSETPEGYALKQHNAEFKEQMEAAEVIMRQYRNALDELAK